MLYIEIQKQYYPEIVYQLTSVDRYITRACILGTFWTVVKDRRIFGGITDVFRIKLNCYIWTAIPVSPFLNSVYFPLSLSLRSFFSLRGLSDLLLFPTLSAQIS